MLASGDGAVAVILIHGDADDTDAAPSRKIIVALLPGQVTRVAAVSVAAEVRDLVTWSGGGPSNDLVNNLVSQHLSALKVNASVASSVGGDTRTVWDETAVDAKLVPAFNNALGEKCIHKLLGSLWHGVLIHRSEERKWKNDQKRRPSAIYKGGDLKIVQAGTTGF